MTTVRLALFATLTAMAATVAGQDESNVIWFDQPAKSFHQSLPLGNGRLGMMVFGDTEHERIVLNEESMWSGSPNDDNRPDAWKNLAEIRRLLQEGKNVEAEGLVNRTFTCQGAGSGRGNGANVPFGCYQTLGNLWLDFEPTAGKPQDYRRRLDLHTAVGELKYARGEVRHHLEYFVSAADQIGVVRITTTGGPIGFTLRLDRPERFQTKAVGDRELLMTGQLNDGRKGATGVRYAARVRVLAPDATVTMEQDKIKVAKASSALILLAAETDYHGNVPRERRVEDPAAMTAQLLDAGQSKPYEQLLARHKTDYQRLFKRVSLDLKGAAEAESKSAELPTPRRLAAFRRSPIDPALAALNFNFGRYLLISSSREGTLPANLQGIWTDQIQTPWNCDWHLNINVQMNYWPAEVANLSECHRPLLKMIESMQQPGRKTAKAYYGAEGWVAHVITNPWGFTAPGESASWGGTCSGSAWLCEHLWDHYAFSGDRAYLQWAYPIMKGSARFYLAMLVEEPEHHWLVTAPSNSPENAFKLPNGATGHVCLGPTVDMQILRELLGNTIRAATILGVDEDFRAEFFKARARLAPNQIAPDGRLQEWLKPYDETEPQHRHVSHLYGLYPADEIRPDTTPGLAAAARKSLERRGDGGTGWSKAWKICFWARLHDGDHAHLIFRELMSHSTLDNLFDTHPPFQIDGNFGSCAGISEMLLQSHLAENDASLTSDVLLLPALPSAWPHGKVQGLRARGGFQVDLEWREQKLVSATVRSDLGEKCTLHYGGKKISLQTEKGKTYQLGGGLAVRP